MKPHAMSTKNSLAWMGLYVLICTVYLLSMFLAPPPPDVLPDFALVLAATLLLVFLVLLISRRARREREIASLLAARDGFLKGRSPSEERPPTSFFR